MDIIAVGNGRSSNVRLLLVLCVYLSICSVVKSGRHENRLIKDLLNDYNPYERPAENESDPLIVEFTVTLQQIIDLDEKNQMINTNIWLTIQWTDYKLRWDPAEYGNVTEIRLPQRLLWKPDILMYNSADPNFDGSWPVNIVVLHTGVVYQLPPGIFTSACPIDITWFPFDSQSCKLKFGSWTYDGTKIDLRMLNNATTGSTDGYRRSGEWDLMGFPVERNVVLYDCCPDNPYYDLTFYINIKRRKLYYLVNIVLPCVMLAALTLLTFTIPCDAGEKISFGVTILLSLTVFLLLVAEALPATSDAVPLIAIYFSIVMLMNAASVVFTVWVLSYHHRNATTHVMPNWVKKGINEWLAWLLCMRRPERDMIMFRYSEKDKDTERNQSKHSRVIQTELKEYTNHSLTTSLLSNGTRGDNTPSLPNSPELVGVDFNRQQNNIKTQLNNLDTPAVQRSQEFLPMRLELLTILKELRVITERLKKTQEDEQIIADWRFAANVIDRFMLWVFLVFVILSSCALLLTVPGIFQPEGGIE